MTGSGVIAVDVGKTGARCAAWLGTGTRPDAGEPFARADSDGLPGLAAPGGVTAATRLVSGLVRSVVAAQRWDGWRLGVGVPGALTALPRATELAEALALALPGVRAAATSDAVTAHCGALRAEPGIVATLGTGVSVLALAADGSHLLVDGAGHYIGDRGGGADIGRQALRAVLRARDGAGPETALSTPAGRRFGALDELAARFADAANPARLAASFAPDVAGCADAGDEVARTILRDAAAAIAASIHATRTRAGRQLPVVATGGLLGLGNALLGPLGEALDGVPLRPPAGDALAGAALLAEAERTGWESVVGRSGRRPAGAAAADRADLVDPLEQLRTEQARTGSDELDQLPTAELVEVLLQHESEAVDALRAAGPQLAAVADLVAERMRRGGRLIYVGAGTPGRLAYLDAAECEPTFGLPPGVVVALVAGGEQAVRRAVEGAEDDAGQGGRDVEAAAVGELDTVVGISASGRTPYVLGGLRAARAAGALTVGVANNRGSELADLVDHAIEIDSGPEVIAGSTRLAAGTTQKLTLNTLSTGVMVRLGKTYRGRMVDVLATNDKLRRRVVRIVRELTGVDEAAAVRAVAESGGEAKTAVVSLLAGRTPAQARAALDKAGGHVSGVLDGRRR